MSFRKLPNMDVLAKVAVLPPELLEFIRDCILAVRGRENAERKKNLFSEVHGELLAMPFSGRQQRPTKIIKCSKCSFCEKEGLCYACY